MTGWDPEGRGGPGGTRDHRCRASGPRTAWVSQGLPLLSFGRIRGENQNLCGPLGVSCGCRKKEPSVGGLADPGIHSLMV